MMEGVLVILASIALVHCHSNDARNYLTKFGYLNPNSFGERTLDESIKLFQHTFGLKETGVIDKETGELMATPRCGIQDHSHSTYSDRAWTYNKLTYYFENYTPDMDKADIERLTAQALNYWSSVSGLSFTLQSFEQKGDIVISFGTENHADERGQCFYPFDGRGGVLAHAFFPNDGRIHFDDAEHFDYKEGRGKINYLWVATHELGHILGLEHDTKNTGAVMFPYYRGFNEAMHLHPNDIARIQHLYPKPNGADHSGHGANTGQTDCNHPDCKDIASNCKKYQSRCKGFGAPWTLFMKRKCKRTCNYCCY